MKLWIVALLALALVACDEDKKTNDAPAPQPDVGLDAEPGQPDVAVEDEDAPEPDPGLTEAVVTGGGATVRIAFDPFSLSLEDADGQVRAEAREGDEAPYAGIAFGKVAEFSEAVYYNPSLDADLRTELTWYRPGRVRLGEAVGEGARFVVRSVSEAGDPGPDLEIEVMPTPQGVSLRVVLDEDPTVVFSNLALTARDGEGFYGLGEMFDKLDNRGLLREMQIQAQADSESATNEVHVPVTFYVSTERYGLFMDDKYPSVFDLGRDRDDAMRVTSLSRDVTFHMIVDDDPMRLVERYTDISGKPAHVPFWSLAPQWWRNVNLNSAEVISDARRGREAGIPSTVMWIDRPWSSYYHNWRFDETRFPEHEAMLEELRDMGYRVLLHHSPQMNPKNASDIGEGEDDSEDLYETFADNGWLVSIGGRALQIPWGGGRGAFVDYSHPDAVALVQEHIERVVPLGVIGTKMDWDEFLQANAGNIRINVEYHNGLSPLVMRIMYSALYHKAIIEGFDRAMGEPSFHVSRSGTPGDQVWNTCIWPGDLDKDFSEHTRGPSEMQEKWNVGGLPAAVVANQSLGMGGYPCFASDIGGFRNGLPEEEPLVRWVAFGVFNAITQLGGGGSTHMAWSEDTPYSPQALDITRDYFKLRMTLVPYIFEHLLEASRTGRPLVRSLWFAHPDDPETRNHERDFLFGPDLLVAPIFRPGVTEREVYLPEGRWIDFWTGESLQGGQTVTRPAPIDIIPIFVRAGAIIARLHADVDTLMPASEDGIVSLQDKPDIRFLIAPGASVSRVDLVSGLSAEVTPGEGVMTVDLVQGAAAPEVDTRFAIAPPTVDLEVFIQGTELTGESVTVARGGEPVVLLQGEDCTDCWSLDADRGVLTVSLASSEGQVVIR